ncbi:hypothetical protein JG725_18885 [Brenneria sp. L3-3C-1]|nr:hypothetical protein [Brenneria sp. L3-3C-1]
MQKRARQAGGSHKTVHEWLRITERVAKHLLTPNIQICSAQYLKIRHIECYITVRLEQGVTLFTLHNDMR